MTMEGEMLGTPAYMAPEQAKGKISQIGPGTDIYALGGLPLKRLVISDTQVTDLSPLRGMQLTSFEVDRGKIADISPLAGMPLERVTLSNIKALKDLAPLQGAPLKHLFIGDIPATKLGPILDSLVEELSIRGPKFEDLDEIGKLPLKNLTVYSYCPFDLNILRGKTLDRLWLLRVTISDSSPLAHFTTRSFRGANLEIRDLSLFKNHPLTQFDLWEADLDDISALAGKQIQRLAINSRRLTDISALTDMPLTELKLIRCPITDISLLKGKKLTELSLHGAEISDISVLAGMPLYYLEPDNCENIRDISALTQCTHVRRVSLPPNAQNLDILKALPGNPSMRIGLDSEYLPRDKFFANR